MPFDYFDVELPESKKTGLNTLKIQQTLNKILFALALYPDLQLAGAFGGVGNIHDFLPFHLGKETYSEILEDIRERRKELIQEPLVNILQNLEDLSNDGYNIDDLYNMISGKQIAEIIVNNDYCGTNLKFYREDYDTPSEYLTFANVIDSMDMHIELESAFHSPDVAPGIWWLIWYDRRVLKGKFRPFALMARLNNEGKICYLQGVWPFEYLMNEIEKIVPLGYKAVHGDYVFLEIRAELIDIKGRGKFHKYNLVRRIDSPTG